MNKTTLPLLLALTLAAGCSPPATPGDTGGAGPAPAAALSDGDKAKIQENTDKFAAAFNAGDFDGMSACYTEGGVLMPPNAPEAKGRKAIKEYIQTMPPAKDFKITVDSIEGTGDRAIVTGTFSVTFVVPKGPEVKDKGKYIEVREKQADGTWLMSRDMFSSDLPMGGPVAPPKAK